MQRRMDLHNITSVSLSTMADGYFILHSNDKGGDYFTVAKS